MTANTPSTNSSMPSNPPGRKRSFGLLRLVIAAVIAAVANLVVFLLASATGTTITAFGSPMAIYEPIAASIVPIVIIGLIAWLLLPYWRGLGSVVPWVGGIVGVLSAIAPLTLVGGVSGLWLAPMHIIAGIAWYFGTRPRR